MYAVNGFVQKRTFIDTGEKNSPQGLMPCGE